MQIQRYWNHLAGIIGIFNENLATQLDDVLVQYLLFEIIRIGELVRNGILQLLSLEDTDSKRPASYHPPFIAVMSRQITRTMVN